MAATRTAKTASTMPAHDRRVTQVARKPLKTLAAVVPLREPQFDPQKSKRRAGIGMAKAMTHLALLAARTLRLACDHS